MSAQMTMRNAGCLLAAACGAVCLTSAGSASGGKVAYMLDEASAVPGMVLTTDYDGPLPAAKPKRDVIPQMDGWPQHMGVGPYFSPSRGLIFVDLDGDGKLEILTSSTDKKIYCWDYTGAPMPGFPVSTIEAPQYPPSAADMDGDGDIEIVQFTRGLTSGGRLYALDHTGTVLPGFPMNINNNNISSTPTLYDLDDDGVMEIIVPERAYPIGYLHIVELDATEWGGGWPVALDHVPACTAAVGDVNNDGAVEIVYLSYDSIYVLDLVGKPLPGWPKQIPNANFSYQSPALADLDFDGDLEIVVGAHKDAAGCYVFHHDGTGYPGWPKYYGTWSYCAPTVTDFEDDGKLEILAGRAGYVSYPSDCFWAWTSSGSVKPGFPYHRPDGGGSEGPITVADINGDGTMEIFADYNKAGPGDSASDGDSYGYLFGVDMFGKDLPGFPLRPKGFTYMNGATIGDVDGDGDYELGVQSYDDYGVDVNLYDLPDMMAPPSRDWKIYHGCNIRGGRYPTAPPCPADITGDGVVDVLDLLEVLAQWGGSGSADITGDGVVDVLDLLEVLAAWGPC